MITATPIMQINPPIRSNRSGDTLSTPQPRRLRAPQTPAISGINASKILCLIRGNDPVQKQYQTSKRPDRKGSAVPPPLPDKITAADFAEARSKEQED
jgi:hypothetical protein